MTPGLRGPRGGSPRRVPAAVAALVVLTAPAVAAAQIAVTPSPHDFGNVEVGTTSAAQTFTVEHTGPVTGDAVEITAFTKTGANCGEFPLSNVPDTPHTLLPGQTTSFDAAMSPAVRGGRSCDVDIEHDGSPSPTTASLSGTGVAAELGVQPASLDFGDQPVGAGAAALSFDIQNTGDLDLTIDQVSLGGTDAAAFSLTGGVPAAGVTLAAGESRTIEVSFDPASTGGKTADVTVESADDPVDSTEVVSLAGTGTAPEITLTTSASLDFGSVLVGDTTPAQKVTIQNDGDADLTVTAASLGGSNPGQFSIEAVPGTPTFTVAPGATATWELACAPNARGSHAAVFQIDTDDADEPQTDVSVACTGVAAQLAVQPGTLDFGGQPIAAGATALTFDVTNAGDAGTTLTIDQVTLGGTDAAAFSLTGGVPASGVTLAAGETHTIEVSFDPAATGDKTADVTVSADDPVDPTEVVALAGTGTAPEVALVTSASLDFGSVSLGDTSPVQEATIRNDGDADLTVTAASLGGSNPGQFSIEAVPGTPTFTVAPGNSATWQLACAPDARGSHSAVFQIETDDGDESRTDVTLSCTGTEAVLSADPDPIQFPTTRVGESSTVAVTLTNDGNVDLDLQQPSLSSSVLSLVSPPGFPLTLQQGAALDLDVRFEPVESADLAETLTIDAQKLDAAAAIAIDAPGRVAAATLSATTIDFGDVRVDEAPQARQVTLANTGDARFQVADVTIDDTGDFAVAAIPPPQLPATLAPGDEVTFEITAQPQTVGTHEATVTATTDVPGSSAFTVAVTATGVSPDLLVSDGAIDFGATDVQAAPAERAITLTNRATASAALELTDLAINGEGAAAYAVEGPALPVVIEPGSSIDATVRYAPQVASPGEPEATLSVVTDLREATIPLTGRGIDRHITAVQGSLVFPETLRNPASPVTRTVEIANTGEADLVLDMVVTGGPAADSFSVDVDAPVTIAGGESRAIAIAFAPTVASAAPLEAALMVSNDDDERPMLEIPLSGRGVVPNLAITPGTIDIGRTGVGVPVTVPDLIEIVNMDDREIEVREIRLVRPNSGDGGGPFQIAGESSASIGARGSVEVGLEFAPETAGVHEVVVEIYTGSDPVRVATTRIRAEAVTVRLRGGGCRTTAGGGGASAVALALLALAGAGRVIRRRAPR